MNLTDPRAKEWERIYESGSRTPVLYKGRWWLITAKDLNLRTQDGQHTYTFRLVESNPPQR